MKNLNKNNIKKFDKHTLNFVREASLDDLLIKKKHTNQPTSNIPSSNSAITLVALVITIIILLILAGVTLTMVMGENGIIAKAQLAKEKTNQSQVEEEKDLSDLQNKIQEYNTITSRNANYVKELVYSNNDGWNGSTGDLVLDKSWNDFEQIILVGCFTGETSNWSEEYITKELLLIMKDKYSDDDTITLSKYYTYYLNIKIKDFRTISLKNKNGPCNIKYVYGVK